MAPAGADLGSVLVVGAAGMLGRAIVEALAQRSVRFRAATRQDLDLADRAAIHRAFSEAPRTVICCAAWTDVDGAEAEEARATETNAAGLERLAAACKAAGAVLVAFGTDYVFDGRASTPYPTDHPRVPINAYGRSKAAGEEALERSGAEWLHIRTSWLYAPWGKNFVRTMARAGRERPVLRVVNDQVGRPTSALHLARATLSLVERGARGHWHVCDGGQCSWFGFAREIIQRTGGAARVEPCTSQEFPRPAARPAYSVLDLGRTEALLGPMPHWTHNLAEVLPRLEP